MVYSAFGSRVISRCLFGPVGLNVVQVFCLLVLSIVESEVLKPPTTIVELFIVPSDPVGFSFMFYHAGK